MEIYHIGGTINIFSLKACIIAGVTLVKQLECIQISVWAELSTPAAVIVSFPCRKV